VQISRRSQCPRGLRHELNFGCSKARIVGSIPLKAWMSVYVFMRRADYSSKESYRLCKKDCETEDETRAQQRAVVPLMNKWMSLRSSPFMEFLVFLLLGLWMVLRYSYRMYQKDRMILNYCHGFRGLQFSNRKRQTITAYRIWKFNSEKFCFFYRINPAEC
jgi:hypothetical protein